MAAWVAAGTLTIAGALAHAQDAAKPAPATPAVQGGPPPGFVAPREPQPGETNADRAKSQPGNNAPFWRAVRESGQREGTSTLPGAEKGVLIQEFVQYPGARLTNAGEAWRQVRNKWIIPYGGSLILIDMKAHTTFAYVMNKMQPTTQGDMRGLGLAMAMWTAMGTI